MLQKLGILLQLVGLVSLPLASAGNLARPGEMSEGTMLTLAGVGILIFTLGWVLRQQAGSR
jgi:hypothetical protein